MKACIYCSKQIDLDSIYCCHCGKRQDNAHPQDIESPPQNENIGDRNEDTSRLVEISVPSSFGETQLIVTPDCIKYRDTIIRYEDIQYVHYSSTKTSINFIPSDQSYYFVVGSQTQCISISLQAIFMIGRKKKEQAWIQLVRMSKYFIEPRIVTMLADSIFENDQVLRFANVTFSKAGYFKKGFFSGEKSVIWSGQIYEPQISQGEIVLYDNSGNVFETVSMNIPNAVVLPELVVECYRRSSEC